MQNLTREYLLSPILKCLEDKIEKIRELAIKLILKLIKTIELDDKMNNLILSSVISRLNHVPFPEACKLINNYKFSRGITTATHQYYRQLSI